MNDDLLKRVEHLRKEQTEKEDKHKEEMVEVIVEVKASDALVVWEAKLKLFDDLANAGSWNTTW